MTTTMNKAGKWTVFCCIAALLAVTSFSPVARADELRLQDKTALEGNRGRPPKRGGGRRHHGGGGSGWGWAALGAAVGLGVLSAVTRDNSRSYTYVEPAPSYTVVYPSTPSHYYSAPTYATPQYVRPNYGQTYVAPAPCNVCR